MNKGEKIKKLLNLAVQNGWKEYNWLNAEITEVSFFDGDVEFRLPSFNIQFTYENGLHDWIEIRLFELVGKHNPEEIGFIEGLCNAHSMIENYAVDNDFYNTYLDLHINIIKDFFIQEDSNKLEFLFETFKHLL